jgi:predicted transposase/invertase (TIGR01784 family)
MKTEKEKTTGNGKSQSKKKRPSKYDAAWKKFIKKHFEAFLEFFFPDIHQDIDFARKPEFLDKELSIIAPDSNVGDRSAGLVVRLPIELEKKLLLEVIKIEEEYKMQYVTTWERMAKKEGEKRGEERGEKRGEEKARLETARELVKYGVDIDIIAKSTGIHREELEKLVETVQ